MRHLGNFDKRVFVTKNTFEFLLVVLLTFVLVLPILDIFTINIFTTRDYNRALDILSGYWIWWGPELSESGYTTGPFFYFFTLLPIYLGGLPYLLYFLLLLFSLSAGLLYHYVKIILDREIAYWTTFIFSTSLINLINLRMSWNPSYLSIFWILLAILSHQIILQNKVNVWKWRFFCILLGLSAQIHISSFSWLIIVALMFRKINLRELFIGLGLILLPQIPFIFWYFNTQSASANIPFVLNNLSFRSAQNLFDFLGLPLIVTFCTAFILYKSEKHKRLFVPVLLMFVFFLIPAIWTLEKRLQLHYLLPSFFILIFYTLILYKKLTNTRNKLLFFSIPAFLSLFSISSLNTSTPAIVMVLICLVLLLSKSFRKFSSYSIIYILLVAPQIQNFAADISESSRFMTHKAVKDVTQFIFENTNWSIEEFRTKTLQILKWPEISLELDYIEATKTESSPLAQAAGAIVVSNDILEYVNQLKNSEEWPHWKKWIEQNKIQILKEKVIENYTVMIYNRIDLSFPSAVQNIGLHYIPLSRQNKNPSGIKYSFTIFHEPDYNFEIYWENLTGHLIFQSEATARYQTVAPQMYIKNPALKYECDDKVKTLLLPDLGHSFQTSARMGQITSRLGDVVLTPIQFDGINCRRFRPIQFSSDEISLKIWNRSGKNEYNQQIKDFEIKSFHE